MSLIALTSAKGAPGVTTTALALTWAWPAATGRGVLLADVDVAGSGIAPGLLSEPTVDTGLLALTTDRTPDAEAVRRHSLALDPGGDRMVLLGLTDPAQARALTGAWPALAATARTLGEEGVDVVADVGRLGAAHEPTVLLEQADVTVLVTGSDLTSLAVARPALRRLHALRGPAAPVMVVVVGEARPYTAAQIATALDLDDVPVLAHDPTTATTLTSGTFATRGLDRSALVRSARVLATHLTAAAVSNRQGVAR